VDPLQALFADLKSSDPSLRFSVLSRIEGMEWDDEKIKTLKTFIASETDPGTKFHMKKILAKIQGGGATTDKGSFEKSAEIETILKAENRDYLSLAMLLETVKRSEAPLVAMALREARWTEFSPEILPFVLQFFKKYGSYEDAPSIEELCRHPDPRVLSAAVEALEKLKPEGLKPLIVPLLVSSTHGIRARAIRLLHKWDPEESLRHFEASLFSEDFNEKQAALFHAFFFPFSEIEPLMLRFLGMESNPEIIQKAGFLFRANPNPEVLMSLVEIMESCREEKRKLLVEIINGVIKSLSQAGLIQKSPEQIMADLKSQYRLRKGTLMLERCRLTLESGILHNKKVAITKLLELSRSGFPEAKKILEERFPKENDPELMKILGEILGKASAPPALKQEVDIATLSAEERLKFLREIDGNLFETRRNAILGLFPQFSLDEKAAAIQAIGRFGKKTDSQLLVECLEDADPPIVCGAIEALQNLHPDALFPFLSKLSAHPSEEVRASAVRALSLFDKKQALVLIEEMMLSVQLKSRELAIQSAIQLDFPSVRKILLKALEKESHVEILQQIRNILQNNLDRDLLADLVKIRQAISSDREKRAFLNTLINEGAKTLVLEGRANVSNAGELLASLEKKIDSEQKSKVESQPSYSLDNIQKIRQQKSSSKPSDPIQVLSNDLRSSDPAMRFSVLSRIESIEWTPERVAAFKDLAEKETDAGTKFHMLKILAHITQDKETGKSGEAKSTELEELLQKTPRDDMSIALLIESVSRKEAQDVGAVLRKTDLQSFSAQVLPFILQFYKKFGKPEDLPAVEKLFKHPDPRVLAAAIEALEKIDPESLKSQIVPLLMNNNHGIRSRAIRLLYRWDPKEAIKHFEATLFSEDPNDRLAALFHAFFFPFNEIEPFLLRFLAVENDPGLLEKAGFLFRANPSPDEPLKLVEIGEASYGEKRRLIKEILSGVVNSLSQAGIIQASPEQILYDLKISYKQKKTANLLERCVLALKSEVISNRQNAVAQLCEMAKRGLEAANSALSEHLSREKDAAIINLIRSHLGIVQPLVQPITESLEKATSEQRLRLFANLTKESLKKIRNEIGGFLKKAEPSEKLALVQALGRVGEQEDASFIQPFLNDSDSSILTATIESLNSLDPDILFPYLPKLVQHAADEVRNAAIRVFALFDKKQAIALVEKMMFSLQPRQRAMAIFSAGQFDFPSVKDLFLKALQKETDLDNFKQIASILKGNLDEDVYIGVATARKTVSGDRAEFLDSFLKAIGQTLISEKKTQYSSLQELNDAVQARIEEEEKRSKAAQPSYALSNIQKMRQQAAEPVTTFDPELVKFAVVAFSIGAILTTIIWFAFLKPSPKQKGKKKPQPGSVLVTPQAAFSTNPIDIKATVTKLDPDGKGIYVKPDPKGTLEYHIILKTKPGKPYEKGKPFNGQIKPIKKTGEVIEAEILMTY